MALTDNNEAFSPPRLRTAPALPRHALSRLPQIHAETSEAASLARFLRGAVGSSAALTSLGILAVALAGGGSLQQGFAWSLLLLIGIGAMLRSYIKSTAQAFDRAPLRESAKDLRAVIFYIGFVWGAGAFLLLGNNPVPLAGLCFAVLPSAILAPLLRDRAAGFFFVAPVTLLTATAVLVEPWADAPIVLALLLVAQGGIMAGLSLSGRAPRMVFPAGLSLP